VIEVFVFPTQQYKYDSRIKIRQDCLGSGNTGTIAESLFSQLLAQVANYFDTV